MDILKDKITVAEVARQHDLTVFEVEGWIGEAQRNMENGARPAPRISASNTSPTSRQPRRR
ncbi:hypothetical protein [Chromohalobacter japonicus]|uniref:hypothetical protein n=1 Tax=Chromohalobacter japonicus TaxID=223900 RepID=UPI001C54E4B0